MTFAPSIRTRAEALDLPDGELRHDRALEESLVELLERLRPRTIYHPPVDEMHPDHAAFGAAFLAALARCAASDAAAFAYEIWVPVVATHVIDVSASWAQKRRAIECHRSQLVYNDYLRAAEGLSAYRSIFLPGAAHVEAYARNWSSEAAVERQDVAGN